MWEDEVKQNLENPANSLYVSMTGFLMQIFPEKWDDIMRMKDVMIKTLESFDNEIKAKDNFNALSSEIYSISPYFIMLYEHINSISEIYWFMKKDSNKRASVLAEKPKLIINTSDIEKTLDILKSQAWKLPEL